MLEHPGVPVVERDRRERRRRARRALADELAERHDGVMVGEPAHLLLEAIEPHMKARRTGRIVIAGNDVVVTEDD